MSNQGKEQERKRQLLAGTHPQFAKYQAIPRGEGAAQQLSRQKAKAPPAPLEVWEDAFNRASLPGGGQDNAESQGGIFAMGADGLERVQVINTGRGQKKIRVQIADEKTLRKIVVAPTTFDVQLAISEGIKGAEFNSPPNQQTFTVPRFAIPVKGKVFNCSESTYAELFFLSTVAQPYRISIAIMDGYIQYDTVSIQNNSGGTAAIPELCDSYTVSVPGGVILGDTIDVLSYSGAVLSSYPAREGIVIPVGPFDASVRYTPIGPVVSRIRWLFRRGV